MVLPLSFGYFVTSDHVVVVVLPFAVLVAYVWTLLATDAFTANDVRMAAELSPTIRQFLPSRLTDR